MSLKTLVDGALRRFDLQLRRRSSHHVDPFADQVQLVGGQSARVVFDVGASTGVVTRLYRSRFPEASVYAFEPSPTAAEAFAKATGTDPKVTLVRAAVGDAAGTATLHLHPASETDSLLPDDPRSAVANGPDILLSKGRVDVPVVTIDQFCADRGIAAIDVLKMDIQGYERHALAGAAGMLARGAVGLIYTEVLFAPQYEGQAYYHDLAAHLDKLGYRPYGLYHLMRGRDGALAWADAIFVGPRLRAAAPPGHGGT
jgi:FkbM family methyltransferase